jgi:protein-disulfide isomerase
MRVSIGGRVLDAIIVLCAIGSTTALVARTFRPATAVSAAGDFHRIEGAAADMASTREIGHTRGPYQLLVWTDYQCPACKRFEGEVERLRAMLPDSVSVVYRHLPLQGHPLAFTAAVLADCAKAQGRFAEMHRALFSRTLSGSELPVDSLSAESGVNYAAARACLSDSSVVAGVRRDVARAKEVGLSGTPALQIGERVAVGGRVAEELLPLLRASKR